MRAVAVLIVFCAQTVEGQWSRSIKDLPPPPPESSATPGSLPAAEFGVPFGLDDSKRQSWNPLQRDLLFAELEKELLAKHYDKLIGLCDIALESAGGRRTAIILRFRGQAYAGKNEWKLALSDYARVIKYDPGFPGGSQNGQSFMSPTRDGN